MQSKIIHNLLLLRNIPLVVIQWFVALIIIGLLIGSIIVFIRLLKDLRTKLHKQSWVLLGLCLLVFLIINLHFHSFKAADEEWFSIYNGQMLLAGNQSVYRSERSGIVFPLLIAGIFKLGISVNAIPLLNICLGTITILLIFCSSFMIFENERASLLSIFIYILTPWSYLYTGVLFGLPTLVHFLSLLSLLLILIAFKYHKISAHILSLCALLVLNQTKFEYIIYYGIYLIYFWISQEYKHFKKLEVVLFLLISLIFCMPIVVRAILFQINRPLMDSSWCGVGTQTFENYSYGNLVRRIDRILQTFIYSRIKLSYFLGDIITFVKFWGQSTLIIPILLFLIGIFVSFRNSRQNKVLLWFPILFFFALAVGYMFDCGWYEARHAISSYGFVVIFVGYCLWWVIDRSNKANDKLKFITYLILSTLLTVQTLLCFQNIKHYQEKIQSNPFEFQSYHFLEKITQGMPKQNLLFITLDNNSRYILQILGYQADSFNDYINSNTKVINYQETSLDYVSNLQLRQKDNSYNIYFIKSPVCNYFSFFRAFCDIVESRATDIKRIDINNESITLQLLYLTDDF